MEPAGRILVVEDNLLVARSFASALQDQQFDVVLAESGEQAWEIVTTDPMGFDVAICDVNLTGLSGEELLEKLRGFAPYLRVVMTSGYVTDAVREKLNKLGAVAFLSKPVFPGELVATVRRVMPT
ncbi:hypothetical protein DB347_22005 [Opitutaceae bacterium EW11]|nr:hypothetical protein DB347_22005 [Opitutaceae bacterium EW11]